jgi:signal transduction histidine kinase
MNESIEETLANMKQRIRKLEHEKWELKKSTAQLIQREKRSALEELLGGVAHELKQPLNIVKIISQSLLKDVRKDRFEKETAEEDLPEIIIQMDKMSEIIDHMRAFTRPTKGTTRHMVDINTIVEDTLKLVGQQLKNHNFEVIKELNHDLPQVFVDAIRIEQVMMNLINNARQVLESCGIEEKRIGIITRKASDDKSVVIEVNDNGPGIAEDIKKKVFQSFFTTGESGKRTGLGLSVSSEIIEEHNGRIELESKVGVGTTFRVILPAGDE